MFLFVYGGVAVRDPTLLAVMFGAGMGLLGLPAAWRLDERRREEADHAERWSGLD